MSPRTFNDHNHHHYHHVVSAIIRCAAVCDAFFLDIILTTDSLFLVYLFIPYLSTVTSRHVTATQSGSRIRTLKTAPPAPASLASASQIDTVVAANPGLLGADVGKPKPILGLCASEGLVVGASGDHSVKIWDFSPHESRESAVRAAGIHGRDGGISGGNGDAAVPASSPAVNEPESMTTASVSALSSAVTM